MQVSPLTQPTRTLEARPTTDVVVTVSDEILACVDELIAAAGPMPDDLRADLEAIGIDPDALDLRASALGGILVLGFELQQALGIVPELH